MNKDPEFHPHYHQVKVVMTDGTEFMTYSTYGQEGDTITLDIDPNSHPAWTGGDQKLMDRFGLSPKRQKARGTTRAFLYTGAAQSKASSPDSPARRRDPITPQGNPKFSIESIIYWRRVATPH